MSRTLTACAVCAVIACLSAGCDLAGKKTGGGGSGSQAAAKKVYDREELRKLLVGKTTDEVINLIGKPEKTDSLMWYYSGISRDAVTGNVDGRIHMRVDEGKVVEVYF